MIPKDILKKEILTGKTSSLSSNTACFFLVCPFVC
jgi:hypothetical protein